MHNETYLKLRKFTLNIRGVFFEDNYTMKLFTNEIFHFEHKRQILFKIIIHLE